VSFLEYLDINELRKDLKKNYKFDSVLETEEKLKDSLSKGVLFKNRLIKTLIRDYYNHLAGRTCSWYFFICPDCQKPCRKLYVTGNNKVACRRCSKIKEKLKVRTQTDRIMRIQMYFSELLNKRITAKKRRLLIRNITNHYQQLDSKYKMIYNTVAFKELQKWCLSTVSDSDKSKEYKKAVNDMLKKLRDVRKILVFSGLSISKNNNLKI